MAILALLTPSDTGAATGPGTFLTSDGARLYYEECGSGPTVVLLHDGLMHSVTWDAVWPSLCARFHVLRYDRRGMGRSEAPQKPFIPAEDLSALLADRRVASATLVGSSSGAGLAVDYALRHPEKVERLVLLGPVVHGMASSSHFLERGARNSAPLAHGNLRLAAKNWAHDRYQIAAGHDAARQTILRTLVANPQNLRYQGNLELRFLVPAAARLGEVRVPTLILVGESDIADVQAYAGALELGIWGALREVVPNAGHLLHLEHPDLVSRRITDFITTHPVVALEEPVLQTCAGAFDSLMYGHRGELYVKDGRLMLRVPTERDLPLFPSSDSTFYALTRGGPRLTCRRDATGKVVAVDVDQAGVVHRAASAAKGAAAFDPNPKTIALAGAANGAVRWVNTDVSSNGYSTVGVTHHLVSNDGTSFDTGDIGENGAVSRTLTAGTYPYHCVIHPSMTGTVKVTP